MRKVLQSVAFITKSNGTLLINWTHTIFQTCHIFRYILLAFVLLSFILPFLFFIMTNLWKTLLQIPEAVLAFLFYYPVPLAIQSRLSYTGAPNRFWECWGQKPFRCHGEWHKNKFPGNVAHICIQQRR